MADDFAGKLALVTGAGQGVGRAVAIGLAKRGARVIATDLVEDAVRQMGEILQAEGLVCEGRKLDVGDAEAVDLLIDELELEQPVELLANIAGPIDLMAASPEDDAWRTTIRVYTDGVFNVTRSVARRMKARAGGAIVIVLPEATRLPRMQGAAFAASKAAAHMFAKGLSADLAEHHVRCEVLEPRLLRSDSVYDVAHAACALLAQRAPEVEPA